ncbi:MAG: hypothetical protein ABIQ93_03285 [Saprospiraceae bacterium]
MPGTYTVTLLAQSSSPGICGPASNQVVIHVVCGIAPTVHAQVCTGQFFSFQGESVPPDTTETFYLPGSPCDSLVSVQVVALPPIHIALPADTVLPTGAMLPLPVTINGTGLTLEWQPATRLSCTDCPQPIVSTLDTITYTQLATDANGCTASDSITLLVDPNCQLLIPNAFTPNSDGARLCSYVESNSRLATNEQGFATSVIAAD